MQCSWLLVFVALSFSLTVVAQLAASNPCDIHHFDELSGEPQDNPDRPCHIHYDKVNHAKKKKLDLQRRRQQILLQQQQQAALGVPSPTDTVPGAEATAAPLRTIDTTKLLVLHGTDSGADMIVNATVQAIFWGASWAKNDVSAPTVRNIISGLGQFYAAHNISRYADTCAEYVGTNGAPLSNTIYQGYVLDTTSTSKLNPGSTSAIGSKVCAKIVKPVQDGHYPVFVDMKRLSRGYCGWHSYGYCNGATYNTAGTGIRITFAFFFNLTGDTGCDVQDTITGHSQPLASLASVAAHELEESRTDPYCCGYWDATGNENGDKCAWKFNRTVTLADGSQWKLQGEWSNAAYQAGTGFGPDLGCLDGA